MDGGPCPPPRRQAIVRAPYADAVGDARDVLAPLPIRRAGDIDVRSIAASLGIFARVERLVKSEGHLVHCAGLGLATIDVSARDAGLEDFFIAHELAHGRQDRGVFDLASCAIKKSDGTRRVREQRANDFAAELKMPAFLFAPFIRGLGGVPGASIEHIFEAADEFRMPDDAIALRMLLFSPLACAAVVSVGGRVKWWACTPRFSTYIPWGARVDARTLAAKLHAGARIPRRGQTLARGTWERSEDKCPLQEQAVALRSGAVLTWLVELL